MKARLAEYAVTLRRLDPLQLGDVSNLIGKIIVDLSRDEGIDVADQLRNVADRLTMFANGLGHAICTISVCDGRDLDVLVNHAQVARDMAKALQDMASKQARAA
jgi:hypothetical protein